MYDISPEESPSTAVVTAVSAVTGYRPVASGDASEDEADLPVLDPLYTVVDPDALDEMFGRDGSSSVSGSVRFSYHDCEVTVRGDAVEVTPPESATE